MERKEIDIYSYKQVRSVLIRQNRFDLVEWIDNNRAEYTISVLNKQHQMIGFYYD